MQRTISSLFVCSLVVWIGAATFFSLIVLPTLFMNLEQANAGAVAALLFAPYFRLGAVAGVLLLGSTVYIAGQSAGQSGAAWKAASAVVAVMLACQLYSTLVLHPEIDAIRGIEDAQPRFDTLHKRSVRLNGVVLLGGIGLVACSGWLFERR